MSPQPQGVMNSSHATLSDQNALKCELATEVLRSSGTLRLRVTGWSMLPTIFPGDILTIERIHSDALSEGDIVLFRRDRRLYVHRFVARIGQGEPADIMTRGDSMPAPDPPVSKGDLLGRVAFILRNGKRIEPRKRLHFPEHAVAVLIQHSDLAGRVVMSVHSLAG